VQALPASDEQGVAVPSQETGVEVHPQPHCSQLVWLVKAEQPVGPPLP
jgi:hypothetical protein